MEEVCYFEFVHWTKNELGYDEVGQIWHKRGCSLYTGRKELKNDANILEFVKAKEKDGWYILYVIHKEKNDGHVPDRYEEHTSVL